MYCKYCGRDTGAAAQVCHSCKSILKNSEEKSSVMHLKWVIIWGLLIPAVVSLIYNGVVMQSANFGSMLISLPSNSCLWTVLLCLLILFQKINVYCCSREESIIWIGGLWLADFYPLKVLETFSIAPFGGTIIICSKLFDAVNTVFEMPVMWWNICFVCFLFVKNNRIVLRKKTVYSIIGILVVWSLVLTVFRMPLLQWVHVPAEYFFLVQKAWRLSTLLLWLRYIILLWFAVLFARRQINYVCVMICMAGFFIFPCMFRMFFAVSGHFEAVGIAETIVYVAIGAGLLLLKNVNENNIS